MKDSHIRAWAVPSAVEAKAAIWPTPTNAEANVWDAHGWSPAPTPAPILGAQHAALELHRRSVATNSSFSTVYPQSNTCGFYQGNANWPFACGASSTCIHDNIHSFFYCCGPDGMYGSTSCKDYNPPSSCFDSTDASYCTGDCLTGYATGLLCTGPADKYCQYGVLTNVTASQSRTYSVLFCYSVANQFTLAPIATYLDTDGSHFPITSPEPGVVINPMPTASSTSQSNTAAVPSSTSTTGACIATICVPDTVNHSAVIGGAVGGALGGLALIAVALYYFRNFLKKRKRRSAAQNPSELDQDNWGRTSQPHTPDMAHKGRD